MVKFNEATVGMQINCKEDSHPMEIMAFSGGDRIQLQMLPVPEGKQYHQWPKIWLMDYEFDYSEYVPWKEKKQAK